MIACTALIFDVDPPGTVRGVLVEPRTCGEPATQRVTVTGADRALDLRPESIATDWNLDRAPRCDSCARTDHRITVRMFPGATFTAEPIT